MLSLSLSLTLLIPWAPVQEPPPRVSDLEILAECRTEVPSELYTVERVIDGDTIWIQRGEQREKLRLLSVDTEERFNPGNTSVTKPSTRFGEECAGWAVGFFAPRDPAGEPVRVGLRFPGGVEARDVYGRLLCHVITSDGIDFNLLLVRHGKSPYFNKYGNSRISHARFTAAQAAARKEMRGIWNSRTNKGGARRPYTQLMPWWQARADALEEFRTRAAQEPLLWVDAEDPLGLGRALAAKAGRVTVFGSVYKLFDEDDGSLTVLFRSGDKHNALRVKVPRSERAALADVDLPGSMEEFQQNYLYVEGDLVRGARGFELHGTTPESWRRASASSRELAPVR